MRAPIATLTTVVVLASACSGDTEAANPYGAQTASIGESLAMLGWNISVSNLRVDGDYVLIDVDASPTRPAEPMPNPKDVRFGLYGALAHPIEATAVGSCRDVTNLGMQPLSARGPTGSPARVSGPAAGPVPGAWGLRVLAA